MIYCPFCGKDKLKIEIKQANKKVYKGAKSFYRITSSVRCNCCHSRGTTTSVLVENIDSETIIEIEHNATNIWNNRV